MSQLRHQSLGWVHLSVFLFGITALFAKLIPLSAAEINIFRSFVGAAAIALLLLLQQRSMRLAQRRDMYWMLLLGGLLGFHWITYFHAMQLASIAIGVISLYTFPLMTVFLEPLLTRQHLDWRDALIAAAGFSGIWLMLPTQGEAQSDSAIIQGILWGLFSAFLFALRNIWQRHQLSQYRGDTSMLYQSLVAGFVCLPFITSAVGDLSTSQWIMILVLSTLLTALPHSLFTSSLRHLKAKTASLISCMQPVYATSLAFLVLKEQPDINTLFGGAIIISTAMLETWRSR